tara:strand:- start:10 stop:2847 length:2838 start_codon:yes stop_codon:yes gene_type:complete
MGKKKTHEEQVKQINVKQLFADKVYKKMRADRYGLTFCCPNDLEKINIKNYTCDWQGLKVILYDESFTQTMLQDPGVQVCEPPAVLNAITGLCEASVTATTVGTNTFTQANADPNGTPTPVAAENVWRFGKECPIIFSMPTATDGSGNNPTFIGNSSAELGGGSWWITYDARDGSSTGGVNGPQHNPLYHQGVTETSLINALAKAPPTGWPVNTTLEFAVPITVPVTKNYYVLLAADNHYGMSLDGTPIITSSDAVTAKNMTCLASGLGSNCNVVNLPSNCNKQYTGSGYPSNYGYIRAWLYEIRITAGCHNLVLKGINDSSNGMFAFMVLDNTRAEIIASTSRDDLTEIASSDQVNNFYSNISATTPWSCTPPAVLYTGAPYTASCPGCQTQTSSTTLECPPGFTLNTNTNLCEGVVEGCDTETLLILVVNQNGDPMPNYDIVFDGGNYTTNDLGELVIVVQNASVNTTHTFNISCICITTSGGCAVQQIDIVVTDPNIETCEYPDLPCECVAPSFLSEIFKSPNMTVSFTDANFAAGDPVTATSYTLAWRYKATTSNTFGPWNEIVGLTMDPLTGIISYNFLALPPGFYEYKIKSICDDSESAWSATNPFIIPEKPIDKIGCIDPKADNYDPMATTACANCCTYTVYGCTDVTANNYYGTVPPNTTLIDDGSCEYGCDPCVEIPVPNGNLIDGIDANTLNASASFTGIAGSLPQTFIDTHHLTFVPGTWYRFSGTANEMYENSQDWYGSNEAGVVQKLSNLIVGATYEFVITLTSNPGGCVFYQYTGDVLQQLTNIVPNSGTGNVQFVAQSTSDTFVFKGLGYIKAFSMMINGVGTYSSGTPGCCDSSASNYNPAATCDDGSCLPIMLGCIDPSAANYYGAATAYDGSCIWIGCTDPNYQACVNYIGPAGPANSPTGFIDPITGQVLVGENMDDGSCAACPQT